MANFQALGLHPRPQLASGGWGLHPQTPKQPPHFEFLATPCTILNKKLEKHGIRGLPFKLLASYLTDRQQYTIVNQCKSKSRDVCGIPQGSTLCPLLFNIYINDLPLASNSTIHPFADDTNLTLSHFNVSTLQQNINNE